MKDREAGKGEWENLPEWGPLRSLIGAVVSSNAASHPGVITEKIIEEVLGRYRAVPRETGHRERRRNHGERIRRLSHAVFRLLDAGGDDLVRQITTAVLKAFMLAPRDDAAGKKGRHNG